MTPSEADSDPDLRLTRLVTLAARQPDIKTDVEANHDDNRWWPTQVTDLRMRMLVAGWSTRISYTMIGHYSRVVTRSAAIGFDQLARMPDPQIASLVAPLGLPAARISYLRSLTAFLDGHDTRYLLHADATAVIATFAAQVTQASYKVAQCALLYARGYHCGIIPVDSGMVTRLAPALGLRLTAGPAAHEQMRRYLETHAATNGSRYRQLLRRHEHEVTVPQDTTPSWWLHLTLIYFKRRYLNHAHPRVCPHRPVCDQVMDCQHSPAATT